MSKRFNTDRRPLCIGDNNTCNNLAGYKEKYSSGKPHYHTRCDKHRRNGHDAKAFRNPSSKRYIPLNKCELCNNEGTARHRIVSGGEYTPGNVVVLCGSCHKLIHSYLDIVSHRL